MSVDLSKYRIVKTDEPGLLGYAYCIYGPRGSEYALVRNKVNPHLMFVINTATMDPAAKIQGHGWWTDEGGKLRPVKTYRYR